VGHFKLMISVQGSITLTLNTPPENLPVGAIFWFTGPGPSKLFPYFEITLTADGRREFTPISRWRAYRKAYPRTLGEFLRTIRKG
jgi:hypothetical protein